MESALRPRDIQARIRAGESAEDVAAAAGVPVERLAAFAAPVLAERDHVAGLARQNPVRRKGETTSHRSLRHAVDENLASRGVDADSVEWDAWKLQDRRWQVKATFTAEDAERVALFVFDQMGRFSVADNEDAAVLLGDGRSAEDADELALVRATQPSVEPEPAEGDAEPEASVTALPTSEADDSDEDDDSDDAYSDGDLQEVDGVYDIVPADRGEMDVLYDMLSSFDEDSVKIYAGLVHPKEESGPVDAEPPTLQDAEDTVVITSFPAGVADATAAEMSVDDVPADDVPNEEQDEPVQAETPQQKPVEQELTEQSGEDEPLETEVVEDQLVEDQLVEASEPAVFEVVREPEVVVEPAVAEEEPVVEPEAPALTEPEQLSLLDEEPAKPAPKPRPRRRQRAQVPSWDEIMFGGPKPGDA